MTDAAGPYLSLELNGVNVVSPVSTTSDGQTFVVAQRAVVFGFGLTQFQRTWLMWPAASPTKPPAAAADPTPPVGAS